MGLDPKLVEFSLVHLTRLRRIVRDEDDGLPLSDLCDQRPSGPRQRSKTLTELPQICEELRRSLDDAGALPEDAVAVEEPGVVLVDEGLVVVYGGEPRCHV